MEQPIHGLNALFQQLGLDASDKAIAEFITRHAPLAEDLHLPDAPFWNEAQAAFLQEAIDEDADWAEVVDTLDALLRH